MPNFDDDDFDGDLPAALRKQIKEKDKQLAELSEKFDKIAKRDRERSLVDVFTEKGVNPKVAKFFPADVEPTPEAIAAWVDEYADVFGITKVEQPASEGANPPPVLSQDAYARLNAISNPSSPNGGDADVLHAINNAASEADLLAMIHGAGGGFQ